MSGLHSKGVFLWKKYKVVLEVIYPTEVEAESEEEAIELAMAECPYDNADEVEPLVTEID